MQGHRIPLRDQQGIIVAQVVVDESDLPTLMRHAWHLHKDGYAARGLWLNGKHTGMMMHRQILGLAVGERICTDHINGDRLDNRRANLRLATRPQNQQNVHLTPRGTSRHRGVSWCKVMRKWVANVQLDRKKHTLGYFDDEAEAARVAAAYRRLHMPYATD